MTYILIATILLVIIIILWALFSGGEKITAEPRDANADHALRRRASDKEIEKEYPEDTPHPKRRKSDIPPDQKKKIQTPFKLPYLSNDIIPGTSRFRVYKRTLLNSEVYAQKGDYATAISLYQGVHNRIQDSEVRHKINANIEYLKNYQQELKEETSHQEEEDHSEVKFKVDGQMPNQINIGLVDTQHHISPDVIAQQVVSQIRDEIREKEKIKDELASIKGIQEENRIQMIKNELDSLHTKLNDLVEHNIPEIPPSIIQAKYDSPVPVQLDPGPILEILDKLPGKGSSESGTVIQAPGPGTGTAQTSPAGAPASAPAPDTTQPSAPGISNNIPADREQQDPGSSTSHKERIREKDDEYDDTDFELISNWGKEKDENSLSDEEIFEKILKEDQGKRDEDSFEIIGDKRIDETGYDILDKKQEQIRQDEENFYRKLIKTDKRLKKELPILKVSFDFSRLPDEFSLSREKNILEYSFYKFKPMLEKAHEFIKRRRVRDAINYYRVVLTQNIPPEFKSMIRRNINDLTEYLEKYFSGD